MLDVRIQRVLLTHARRIQNACSETGEIEHTLATWTGGEYVQYDKEFLACLATRLAQPHLASSDDFAQTLFADIFAFMMPQQRYFGLSPGRVELSIRKEDLSLVLRIAPLELAPSRYDDVLEIGTTNGTWVDININDT